MEAETPPLNEKDTAADNTNQYYYVVPGVKLPQIQGRGFIWLLQGIYIRLFGAFFQHPTKNRKFLNLVCYRLNATRGRGNSHKSLFTQKGIN